MMKMEALVRANFGTDPGGLGAEEWARLASEALWLETWRLRNLAQALARLYGGG